MDFLLEPTAKRAVADLGSDADLVIGELSYGEVVPLRLTRVQKAASDSARLWDSVSMSGSAIRVALGSPLTAPRSGTFTLSYGGDGGTLNYNFTVAELNTLLGTLVDFATDGGGVATDEGGGLFYITFSTTSGSSRSLFTATGLAGLQPQSTAEITRVVTGNISTHEVQSIRLVQLPAVEVTSFSATSASAATVTVIATGATNVNAKVKISFSPTPHDGFWTMTLAAPGPSTVTVTGGLTPDATGTYTQVGTINGRPLFTLNAYTLMWDSGAWHIYDSYQIATSTNRWIFTSTNLVPAGSYTAAGSSIGTATVSAMTPIGGTKTTAYLAHDISADDLVTALEPITGTTDDAPNVSVSRDNIGVYYLTFVNGLAATDIGTITIGSSLEAQVFMVGSLDLRDIDAERLLAGADGITLYLEIEETQSGGTPQKLLRKQVTLVSPVLNVA